MRVSRRRSDPQKTLVGFYVGDVHYALPIARVAQIVQPLSMTILPHLPRDIVGVADHRGVVLPVIDLRVRFGLTDLGVDRRTKWILVAISGQPAALVVDSVSDVFGTMGEQLRPSPGLGTGDDLRGIMGVITHDSVLTFVLDANRMSGLLESFGELGLDAGDLAGLVASEAPVGLAHEAVRSRGGLG